MADINEFIKREKTLKQPRDQIFSQEKAPAPFKFDRRVAAVFADMISRSVPGYEQLLNLLPTLTRQFQFPKLNYYDLGCSLGAGMLAMAEGLKQLDCKIIGVDNSAAMLDQARPVLDSYAADHVSQFKLVQADITSLNLQPAAMVLMNFTLQFVPLEQRDQLLSKIYFALTSGGILVVSEKIDYQQLAVANVFTRIHHQYKSDQGYSALEISQKRDAIENVLIPETLDAHTQRLQNIGFSVITPWLQNLQFVSILAIK